jgi:hypothetical protein
MPGEKPTSCDVVALDETEAAVVAERLVGRSYREIGAKLKINFMTVWHIAQRPHVRAKIDELASVAVLAAQEVLTTRMPELLDTALGIADGTIDATPARARMVLDLLARGGLVAVEKVEVTTSASAAKSDEDIERDVMKAAAAIQQP